MKRVKHELSIIFKSHKNAVQSSKFTQTLSFGLDIHTGCGDWNDINATVVDNANHVKNTSQLIVDNALGEIETYHDNKDDGWGRPYPYIGESYPMVMNHGEGYRLFPDDGGSIRFRVTATRGTHVKGELRGSPDHFDQFRTAFNDDEWRVGTAK